MTEGPNYENLFPANDLVRRGPDLLATKILNGANLPLISGEAARQAGEQALVQACLIYDQQIADHGPNDPSIPIDPVNRSEGLGVHIDLLKGIQKAHVAYQSGKPIEESHKVVQNAFFSNSGEEVSAAEASTFVASIIAQQYMSGASSPGFIMEAVNRDPRLTAHTQAIQEMAKGIILSFTQQVPNPRPYLGEKAIDANLSSLLIKE